MGPGGEVDAEVLLRNEEVNTNRRPVVVGAAALLFLALGTSICAVQERGPKKDAASEPGAAGENPLLTGPAVFKLDEVPAFGRKGYSGGQYVQCSTQPSKHKATDCR
jgi:hypothetical protein